MTSTDLVPISADLEGRGDRIGALEQLSRSAEAAATPEVAHEIMIKGRAIGDLLTAAQAPFEEAWLAGKASVLAARRLGCLLGEASAKPEALSERRNGRGGGAGFAPSPRGVILRGLGMASSSGTKLIRLSQIPDPEFQRYIQNRSSIPSLYGALRFGNPSSVSSSYERTRSRNRYKRNTVGVKRPQNPSLDEGYSLIVRALGHLSNVVIGGGGPNYTRDIGRAIDFLYEAEDIIKPYRGGYVR